MDIVHTRNKHVKLFFSTFIMISLLLIFILLSLNEGVSIKKTSNFANWLGILIYVYAMYSWRIVTDDNWFSPYFIFYTFFTLFNFGQCIMWAFGIHNDNELGTSVLYYGSGIYATDSQLLNAKIFVCICMLLFHFGALLCYKPSNLKKIDMTDKVEYTYKAIYSIGILIGIISIPVTLYRSYNFFSVARIYGYKALYYSSYINQGGITMIAEMFFFPSLVCLLIGSKYRIGVRRFVYTVFILYLLLNLFSGDRGNWLYKLIILVWLSSKYYKPVKLKKLIFWGFIGVVGLYIVNAITSIRDIGLQNIDLLRVISIISLEQSPIVDAFFEMGSSMGIITYLLITGNGIWPYGNTYLMSILGMVSTRVLSFLGMPFVLVDDWFSQEHLGLNWGTGFSMIGEAYLNGGIIGGPLIITLLGCAISSLICINKHSEPQNSPLKYFIVATALNTLIGLTRGSMYLYLKKLFYGTISVSIVIILVRNILIKRYNKILDI